MGSIEKGVTLSMNPAYPEKVFYKKDPERGNWSKPIEFVLSCLNYAVGLGNVWRFPYLAFRNGGGAFILPYGLMVFIIGLPIFFAELVIGQFSGQGPIKAYAYIAPLFKGVGYCTVIVITFVTIYYQLIMSWIIYYLYSSFSSVLKWGTCDNEWNSDYCYTTLRDQECAIGNSKLATDKIYWKQNCTSIESICSLNGLSGLNSTHCFNAITNATVPLIDITRRVLSSEEFYNENMLGLGNSTWTNWGWPQPHLVICLAIAWIVSFFCVIKGVQTMGKVNYFTAVFPYIILITLLIRGLTLDGAWDGIKFYITPQWDRLLSPGVWGDASSQIFYSFGIGCGSLVTLASYNKFKNNCHFDALFVSFANFGTALLAGFVVFAILGFLSKSINIPINEVIREGQGLSFITYPEAALLMPFPKIWTGLFFFMMFTLGLGSQLGGIEAINTSIIDHWPHLRKHQWRVTAGTCLACFIAALPMTCNGGIYLFTLLEWHTASWAILLIGFAEVIVISWVYGMDKVFENIGDMGMKLSSFAKTYWRIIWIVVSPIGSLMIFAFSMSGTEPTYFENAYGQRYVFPIWADILGWLIGTSTLVPLVYYPIKSLMKGKPRGMDFLQPTAKWGPRTVEEQEKNITVESHHSIADAVFPIYQPVSQYHH